MLKAYYKHIHCTAFLHSVRAVLLQFLYCDFIWLDLDKVSIRLITRVSC